MNPKQNLCSIPGNNIWVYLWVNIWLKWFIRKRYLTMPWVHWQSQMCPVVWIFRWHRNKVCCLTLPGSFYFSPLKTTCRIIHDIPSCLINWKLNEHSRNLMESDTRNVNQPMVRREIDVPNCKPSPQEWSLKSSQQGQAKPGQAAPWIPL